MLLLSVTDIQPYRSAYDKHHKHDCNNGLCFHKSVLLFLFLKAYEAENACAQNRSSRKAYPQGKIKVIACFRGVPKLVVHLNDSGSTNLDRSLLVGGQDISCGIRVNPEYSEVETELYNPCAPGTRFGVMAEQLPDVLPQGIDGFHCHCHCESSSYELERTLEHLEAKFSRWFPQIKWLNLGGGHLMTRKDYDVEHLIRLLRGLKERYPHLRIILEPGSAFTWQTGVLASEVVDIVENRGIRTAILNVSFTCHMPDCLEMPYQPAVRGAEMGDGGAYVYRLGGNSCLSGDYMGLWSFDHELQIGERIIFEDMIHYTMVKTNMFNGIHHPAIAMWTKEGKAEIFRKFSYEDYRNRMS